ncbi:MAG: phosphatidylserine decarboxylase [Lachnospiraceae bacterium]|nr:phosphatidylserine decarboxylase [Lachnospiraceae bacterium]
MKDESILLRFFYHHFIGRIILRIVYSPLFSKLIGFLLNQKISTIAIKGFIQKHQIEMKRFEKKKYTSFNQFFTRKLNRKGVVPDKNSFISPCDGKLSVYEINDTSTFQIKNARYCIKQLLEKEEHRFNGGLCLIFRLEARDYHRYCYIDDGRKNKNTFIKGKLHTVQQIATDKHKVYHTNAREWTELNTNHFGTIIQVEVGALLVGKIKNYHENYQYQKGEEKGRFEFGGSTIILLIEKNRVNIVDEIIDLINTNTETNVSIGETIGVKCNHK